MKQYYSSLFFAILAATTFNSCEIELDTPFEEEVKPVTTTHVVFQTSVADPSSKATLTPNAEDSAFEALWESTDKIQLYALSDTFDEIQPATWNSTEGVFEADFETSTPTVDEDWSYKAKYPYIDKTTNIIPFGSSRTQNGNNYNSAFDVMFGSIDYSSTRLGKNETGDNFVIPMNRLTGIAYFHITGGPNEDVVSATLTVSSGNIAAETVAINNTGTAIEPTNGVNNITISFPVGQRPKATDLKLWYNVIPGSYSGLSLVIKTASHTSSLVSNRTMTYVAGKLNKVVLDGLKWVEFDSHSITWSKTSDWSDVTNGLELTSGDYTVTITDGTTTPATVNDSALDARVYSGGTAIVAYSGYAMSKIIFNISTQGKKRLAPITASTGTISTQVSGDDTVVWTGKATSVTFTVGATADYGSDGSSKAGQLDFGSVEVETIDDGLSDAGIAFASYSYTALTNKVFVAPTLTNPNSVPVTYSSSNTAVATVNESTGAITIVDEGETTIKATFAGNATYRAAVASYTLSVADPSIVAGSTTPAKAGYADNSEVTFTVTANCSWEAVKGTDENTIIKSINVSENTVTVRFNANTEESEKTATVNLNQTGADSSPITVPVTVTQNAKPSAAANGTTLWSEDFTGKSATGTGTQASFTCNTSNVYSGLTVTYTFADNGTNRTQIYDANSAGGTSPELLIGKTSGSYTVSGIPSGAATGMTLTYVANGALSISSPTTGVTADEISVASNPRSFRINNSGPADTFTLVFSNTSASNVRIDNIVLKAGAPVAGVSVTTAAATLTETALGTSATLNGTLAAINGGDLANVTSAGFYYQKTSTIGDSAPTKVTVSPAASISKAIEGLEPGNEYTFYAFAAYDGGDEVLGSSLTFTPTVGVTTYEVVFTPTYVSKTFGVTITGDKTGFSASYNNTYTSANQMTSGKECTLTISGMGGKKIVGASISARSNAGGGSGYLTLSSNSVDIATIASSSSPLAFSNAAWNGSYSSSYVDIDLDVTETTIGADKTVVLVIHATANSLYFGSLTLQYQ